MFSLILLNEEAFAPLPFLRWTNAAAATIVPRSDSRMALKWNGFKARRAASRAPPPGQAAPFARAAGASRGRSVHAACAERRAARPRYPLLVASPTGVELPRQVA